MTEKHETTYATTTTTSNTAVEIVNASAVRQKNGTRSDERDMERMGKVQELRVSLSASKNRLSFDWRWVV